MQLEELLTADIFAANVTLVCKINATIQTGPQLQMLGMIDGAVIHDNAIELEVLVESADLAEEGTAATGGQVEGLFYGQGLYLLILQTPAQL